jgi:hypothetical protein
MEGAEETMRKLFLLFAAAILVLGLSAQAGAATLTITSNSVLGIGLGTLPPLGFDPSSTPSVVVDDVTGAFTVPANLFTGFVAVPTQLFTGVDLISGLAVDIQGHAAIPLAPGNPGGSNLGINRPGGGLGGEGALDGTAIVNVLFLFDLNIPLAAVGVEGGFVTALEGNLRITAFGTGWTTGAVQITGITTETPAGNVINTVTFVGFDNRGPGGVGQVQIISPFKAVTNAAGNLPGLAVMTLNFVPEAGTLLLLGSGVVGLALLGRRRMRK